MNLNKDTLEIAIKKTMESYGGRNITVYSTKSLRVLHYFERTLPGTFSKGIMAATILEREVAKEYPEIWEYVAERIPKINRSDKKYVPTVEDILRADLPAPIKIRTVSGTLHLTYSADVLERLKNEAMVDMHDPDLPELGQIDKDELTIVDDIITHRDGRLVSVYSPRVSAVMRYLTSTKNAFKPGRVVAALLERGIEGDYPEFFCVW